MDQSYYKKEISDKAHMVQLMKTTLGLELHVDSFSKVKIFYEDIEFETIYESPGNYLTMRLGDVILNFWGDGELRSKHHYFSGWDSNTKVGYGVEIVIPVNQDISLYYAKIKDRVKIVSPLKKRRWGALDFRIEDINGFYLRFTEPHDWIYDFKGYTEE